MKILITGDSHTAALKLGMDMLVSQGECDPNYQIDLKQLGGGDTLQKPFVLDKGSFIEMTNEEHRKRIERLPIVNGDGDYAFYGISAPLHTIRIWRHKHCWDTFSPFPQQSGRIPVSTALLRHAVLQDQVHIMQFIELLDRIGLKLFIIEGPRPFRHHWMFQTVEYETIAYIDQFYRKVMRDWLAAKNIPVVDIPADCIDAGGFMDEKFRNERDGFHANKEFGAVMIKQVVAFLNQLN